MIDDRLTTVHNHVRMQPDFSPAAGETIGQRLKRLRLDRGLSQRELAAPASPTPISPGSRQAPGSRRSRRSGASRRSWASPPTTSRPAPQLDPAAEREIRLSDLELAIRLGEWDGVEEPLDAAVAEAVADGDHASALRGRVALATLASERRDYAKAATLLEAALETSRLHRKSGTTSTHNLGRVLTEAGRPQEAVELFERCLGGRSKRRGRRSLDARYAMR